MIERERRTIERRIKEAKFPAVKSLDSFDFAALPALNKTMVLELARSEYGRTVIGGQAAAGSETRPSVASLPYGHPSVTPDRVFGRHSLQLAYAYEQATGWVKRRLPSLLKPL
jgi:hypothetical protein